MNEADKFLQNRLRQKPPQLLDKKSRPMSTHQKPKPLPKTFDASSDGSQQMVSMREAVVRFWTNRTFNGRASRSEFWFAFLANFLCVWVITFLSYYIPFFHIVKYLFFFAMLVPFLCIGARRLHDIGKSAFYMFFVKGYYTVFFILKQYFFYELDMLLLVAQLVGPIFVLALLCFYIRKSKPHENEYGPMPNVR